MAVDISEISDRAGLAKAIAGRTDEDINRSLAGRCGSVITQLAEGMKTHFVPAKAPKERTVIQYDVRTPDGVMTFQVSVDREKCDVQQGAPLAPKIKLNLSLPDLLRLASGKLNALSAIMTGRLGVSGDVLLARKLQGWFEN